jgi:hypothetical protein
VVPAEALLPNDRFASQVELVAVKRERDPHRCRFVSPTGRRLGPVDYALLALIVLGVAVTIFMAIANP